MNLGYLSETDRKRNNWAMIGRYKIMWGNLTRCNGLDRVKNGEMLFMWKDYAMEWNEMKWSVVDTFGG